MKRLILIGLVCLIASTGGAFAQGSSIEAVVWSPDGTQLAVATEYHLSVFDVANGNARLRWQTTTEWAINTLIFNPSSSWIVAGMGDDTKSNNGYIGVWDARNGVQVTSFAADEFSTYDLAFSVDSSRLIDISTLIGRIFATKVWNTGTWQEISTPISGRNSEVVPVFSPNGQYLAFTYWRYSVTFLDPETYKVEAVVHEGGNNCIAFNDDASQVVLGFEDSVQVWAIYIQPEVYLVRQALWQNEQGSTAQSVVGCSTRYFATVSADGTLRICDTLTDQIEQSYQEKGFTVRNAAFSRDGTQVAFVNETSGSQYAEGYQSNDQVAIWNWNGQSAPDYLSLNGR